MRCVQKTPYLAHFISIMWPVTTLFECIVLTKFCFFFLHTWKSRKIVHVPKFSILFSFNQTFIWDENLKYIFWVWRAVKSPLPYVADMYRSQMGTRGKEPNQESGSPKFLTKSKSTRYLLKEQNQCSLQCSVWVTYWVKC